MVLVWALLAYAVGFWALMLWSMWRRYDIPKDWRVLVGLFLLGPVLFPLHAVRYGWRRISRRTPSM